jgi:hypothetical protein
MTSERDMIQIVLALSRVSRTAVRHVLRQTRGRGHPNFQTYAT